MPLNQLNNLRFNDLRFTIKRLNDSNMTRDEYQDIQLGKDAWVVMSTRPFGKPMVWMYLGEIMGAGMSGPPGEDPQSTMKIDVKQKQAASSNYNVRTSGQFTESIRRVSADDVFFDYRDAYRRLEEYRREAGIGQSKPITA